MYGVFPLREFVRAVENKKDISFQLERLLKYRSEVMPEYICRLLNLPEGSSYSSGILKYPVIGKKERVKRKE